MLLKGKSKRFHVINLTVGWPSIPELSPFFMEKVIEHLHHFEKSIPNFLISFLADRKFGPDPQDHIQLN